jgi:hypothetical protein
MSVELDKKFVDDMVHESDIIIVGHVTGLHQSESSRDMYASIKAVYGIKGFRDVNLIYRTGIRELDPDCCEVGKTYLLFLRRQPNGFFVTVGGRQGSIEATSVESHMNREK